MQVESVVLRDVIIATKDFSLWPQRPGPSWPVSDSPKRPVEIQEGREPRLNSCHGPGAMGDGGTGVRFRNVDSGDRLPPPFPPRLTGELYFRRVSFLRER